MARYTVQAPDGQHITLEGPDGASDAEVMAQAQALYKPQAAAPAAPAVQPNTVAGPQRAGYGLPDVAPKQPMRGSVGMDVLNSGLKGVDESVGAMGDMAAKGFGLPAGPTALLNTGLSAAAAAGDRFNLPIVSQTARSIQAAQGYKPQTTAGEVARTTGQILPAAITGGGSLPQKVANVVVPTITTELAGRGAKALGAPQGVVDLARAAGGISGGLAANARIAPGTPRTPSAPTPAVEDIRAAKNAAYKTVDEAGVQYRPEATQRLAADVRAATAAEEIDPVLHPKALAVQARIDKLADQPLTLTRIDKVRRSINDNVLSSASKDERRIGHIMRDTLDDFVANTKQEDVLSNGDPQQAAQALTSARELNTRVAKIDAIQGAQMRAQSRTTSTGSGGNIDNATRQEVRKVWERGRNWTPDEDAALKTIVEGSKAQNLLRQVGKMSPSGNGLMQAGNLVTAGATHGASLPISAAAMAAKAVADGMTKANVSKVIDLMATGKDAQELARLTVTDPKSASLIAGLGRLQLGSSTAKNLSDGSWSQPPQGSPQSQPIPRR